MKKSKSTFKLNKQKIASLDKKAINKLNGGSGSIISEDTDSGTGGGTTGGGHTTSEQTDQTLCFDCPPGLR